MSATETKEQRRKDEFRRYGNIILAGQDAAAYLSQDGDMRMLGVRDGLAHSLIWVRNEIARIDGRYAPTIHPRHVRLRKRRDEILRPLQELERRIASSHADVVKAYEASLCTSALPDDRHTPGATDAG